jgi:hypothetical protein
MCVVRSSWAQDSLDTTALKDTGREKGTAQISSYMDIKQKVSYNHNDYCFKVSNQHLSVFSEYMDSVYDL